MKATSALLISLLIATKAVAAEEQLTRIEHDAFNQVVKVATNNGETWVTHPVAVSLLFIGHQASGHKSISHQERISMQSTPEAFEDAVVMIERSGFLDDSLAGDKYLITLAKQPSNEWLVESAHYGRRCRDGRGHTNYSGAPCL